METLKKCKMIEDESIQRVVKVWQCLKVGLKY